MQTGFFFVKEIAEAVSAESVRLQRFLDLDLQQNFYSETLYRYWCLNPWMWIIAFDGDIFHL